MNAANRVARDLNENKGGAIRFSRAMIVLAGVLLVAALCGCGSGKPVISCTLLTEPESGYQSIYW